MTHGKMDTGTSLKRVVSSSKIPLVLAILIVSGLVGHRPSQTALTMLVGALGALLLLQQPALGLAAMAALSFTLPLEFGTGSDVSITPPAFLIPAIALVWLVDGLRKHTLQLPTSRTMLPLFLFAGSGLLSFLAGTVYWDPSVPRADNLVLVQLAQWGIFVLSAAIFVLAGDLGRRVQWLERATWTFLILAGVVVLENYVPWLQRSLGWSSPLRAKSGVFGAWLGALATGQLLFNRRLGLLAKTALFALLAAAAYVFWFQWNEWTSGLGPFTAATLAVVWLYIWRRSRRVGLAAVLVGVVLAIALYPIVFALSGGERELEYSWGGRLVLYRAVLDLAKEHPILGLGPAAYRHYGFTQWLSLGAGSALYLRPNISSHNNYIDIYAQVGLLGLGLFLWFVVCLGLVGWRLRSRFDGDFCDGYVHGALGGLVGSLVAMMLVDWFLPYVYNVGFAGFRTSALAWMFLGGLVALEQKAGGPGAKANLTND